MKTKTNKVHFYYWLAIPIILIISTYHFNSAIDIQLQSTYFIIGYFHIGLLVSAILGLIGFGYWLVRKQVLISWMTTIHHLLNILLSVLLIVLINFKGLVNYVSVTRPGNQLDFAYQANTMMILFFIIWLSVQGLFVCYLLYCLIFKRSLDHFSNDYDAMKEELLDDIE